MTNEGDVKMMKKLCVILAIVLLVLSLLVACGEAEPTASPTISPTASPTATPVVPVVLKFSTATSETGGFGKTLAWWMNEVEKRSNGQITFEPYWSGTLAPTTAQLSAIESGAADVAVVHPSNETARLNLANFGSLPSLYANVWPADMASIDLYSQVPAMEEEIAKAKGKFIFMFASSPQNIVSTVPIKSLEDIKGKKIRTIGYWANLIDELGGVPVGIATAEIYTALERGTIDASVSGPSATLRAGLQDVAKYFYTLPIGGALLPGVISQSAWDKLTPENQQMIKQLAIDYAEANHRIYQVEDDEVSLTKMKDLGIEVTLATPEAITQATTVSREKVWPEWIKQVEGMGLDGQAVMDAFFELVNKYEPMSPFK